MMKKKALVPLLLISVLAGSACSKEQERQTVVVKEPQAQGISYTTTEVVYDDIVVTESIECTYTQTKEYELSFGIGERQVRSMDVKKGDLVTEGQLLCSLDVEDMEDEIPRLSHEYEVNVLKLKQQRELLEFDKNSADKLNQKLADIEKQYRDTIRNLEDAVTISGARLAEAKKQVQEGMIYAPVAGEVTFVSNLTEGSYSTARETVVIISDLSSCYFQTNKAEHMELFEEGETYHLQLDQTEEAYEVTPAAKEQWEQDGVMRFRLADDTELVELGAKGELVIGLGEKEHVLCVPVEALHTIEDGYYVYLLDDGARRMQIVQIGLSGEDKVEIVSGLNEHDIVILNQKAGGNDDGE